MAETAEKTTVETPVPFRYPEEVRVMVAHLWALSKPMGEICEIISVEFGRRPDITTVRGWVRELKETHRESGEMDDKQRRLAEYVWMNNQVVTRDRDRIAALESELMRRGGFDAIVSEMDDQTYLQYEQKEISLISRRVNENLRLLTDADAVGKMPQFIIMASQQDPGVPDGSSDSGDAQPAIIDADFEQVADIPAARVCPQEGDTD